MEERLRELEQQMQQVLTRLTRIEAEISGRPADLGTVGGAPPTAEAPTPEVPAPVLAEGSLASAATHMGRTLLIFGGAYLLRALTDFGIVPVAAGVLLGGLYALAWLFMAFRAAGEESQRATAVFYGIASIFLTMPILVEATTRFQLLSGSAAAIALTVFGALVFFVATRRNLQSLAWLATLSGIATALILLRATHQAVPFAIFLLLLGLGSLWAVYRQGWKALQWFGAGGANLGVAVIALLANNEQWTVPASAGYVLGLLLLVSFALSFAIRTHLQRHTIGAFEVAQGLLAITLALWTATVSPAVATSSSTPRWVWPWSSAAVPWC